MAFESEGVLIVAIYLHMVAAGELCCLSDNSGFNMTSTLRTLVHIFAAL